MVSEDGHSTADFPSAIYVPFSIPAPHHRGYKSEFQRGTSVALA